MSTFVRADNGNGDGPQFPKETPPSPLEIVLAKELENAMRHDWSLIVVTDGFNGTDNRELLFDEVGYEYFLFSLLGLGHCHGYCIYGNVVINHGTITVNGNCGEVLLDALPDCTPGSYAQANDTLMVALEVPQGNSANCSVVFYSLRTEDAPESAIEIGRIELDRDGKIVQCSGGVIAQ